MPDSINDLEIYRDSMDLGEEIWGIVTSWDYFAKATVGKQFVRAADSVAANLSEGFGRYHFKDKKKFYYYSRGSAAESQTWLEKAARRKLVEKDAARVLYSKLEVLQKRINAYIRTVGSGPAQPESQA